MLFSATVQPSLKKKDVALESKDGSESQCGTVGWRAVSAGVYLRTPKGAVKKKGPVVV